MSRHDAQANELPVSDGDAFRIGFLVIGRKRLGFDPEWAQQMEEAAWQGLQRIFPGAVSPGVRAVDDSTLRAALHELHTAGCDVLLVLQPSMGDGRLAPILAQLAERPLVLWATPERPDGDKVSSCSLVGTHVFASILRQQGRPFELVYGSPDDAKTYDQLSTAIRVSVAAAKLARSKVGLVGSHAPGFINMQVDAARLSQRLGVALHHFGLQEFFDRVENQDAQVLEEEVSRARCLGLAMDERVSSDDLATDSRFYWAMRSLMRDEYLDALAVRCWPELPQRFGAWPYLAMARLASEGSVVALEGDVDAICSLIGKLLGAGVGYISDWLEHDERSITLWHPGHAPLDLCRPDSVRLGHHFNNDLPLVVDAELAADRPITLFRLWSCDGVYHLTACDAHTEPPQRKLRGAHGRAVVESGNVAQWFAALCHAGMPHHITVLPGHYTAELQRLARWLNVNWVAGP